MTGIWYIYKNRLDESNRMDKQLDKTSIDSQIHKV